MPAARKRKAADSPEGAHMTPRSTTSSKPNKKSSSTPTDSETAIVGGLNGDYRITGTDESNNSSGLYKEFTIPAEENKVIPCRLYHPNPPTSPPIKHLLIFTHGAGGGIENPATQLFAEGYAAAGMGVLCFQGTMNLKNRTKLFGIVLEHCKESFPSYDFAVGGRSMGARAAVMLAAEHEEVKKVLAVSYPLVNEKGDIRDEILIDLGDDKAVYFLTGDKDNMCDLHQLENVRKKMAASSNVMIARGADHSMSVVGKVENKGKAVANMRRTGGSMAASWVRADETSDQDIMFLDCVPGSEAAATHSEAEFQPNYQNDKSTDTKQENDGGNSQEQDETEATVKKAKPMNNKRKRQPDDNSQPEIKASAVNKKQKPTPKRKTAKMAEELDKTPPRRSARLRS